MSNAWWLTFVLSGFFIAATTYIIPYNALLAELTHTTEEKVKLSTFQQVGFVLGMIFGALCNNFADLIQTTFNITERSEACNTPSKLAKTMRGCSLPLNTFS